MTRQIGDGLAHRAHSSYHGHVSSAPSEASEAFSAVRTAAPRCGRRDDADCIMMHASRQATRYTAWRDEADLLKQNRIQVVGLSSCVLKMKQCKGIVEGHDFMLPS
jgi:hypothetical protein